MGAPRFAIAKPEPDIAIITTLGDVFVSQHFFDWLE